jgi:Arc/MetJ family transcription regulator
MRTTIDLADDLMAAVRQRAREQGVTMRAVIEDALRRSLTAPSPQSYRLDLPVTVGTRPPAIDVDSNAEIDAYLDADDARR